MDSYDAVSFFNGLVFFAPVSLLVRTQAGVSQSMFFLLQALLSAITFLGEIPTGFLTDRIGYKRSLVLSQGILLLARFLLFVGLICKSPVLFSVEAIVEGLSYCFVSGTDSAYVYEVYGTKNYLSKMAHASNCGTAGFLISTVSYVVIYHVFNIEGLLLSTIATSMAAAFFSFKLKKEPSKVIAQKEPQNVNTTAFTEIARVFCHGTGKYSGRSAWCENTASGGIIHSEHGGQHYGDTSTICIGSADGSRNRMVFYWSRHASNYLHVLHIWH